MQTGEHLHDQRRRRCARLLTLADGVGSDVEAAFHESAPHFVEGKAVALETGADPRLESGDVSVAEQMGEGPEPVMRRLELPTPGARWIEHHRLARAGVAGCQCLAVKIHRFEPLAIVRSFHGR